MAFVSIVLQILNCPSIFGHTLVKADPEINLYILLIPVCVFGGCLFWKGRVVIPVDIQRVHHFSTAGLVEMMNRVIYLQELQSGPSCVASMHSMLG